MNQKTRSGKSNPKIEGLLLRSSALSKNYEGPNGSLKILKGIDLEISDGEMVIILGRSGSGKSTLLHLLSGLDRPSGGKIFFRGEEISSFNDWRISEYRLRNVGFVFQFYYLLPELTLFENVVLPNRIAGNPNEKRVKELLNRVGLSARAGHYPAQLSGGEQQRAAIARSLANNPDVVFCDEPTGNLDEETANSVFDLLVSLNREEKKTFVVVTHETSLMKKGRTAYELREGILHHP